MKMGRCFFTFSIFSSLKITKANLDNHSEIVMAYLNCVQGAVLLLFKYFFLEVISLIFGITVTSNIFF